MDADGNIVAKPTARSVISFESTRKALVDHADLVRRIETGEKGLDSKLLLCEHALGKVDAASFKQRSAALTDLSKEQTTAIAQINLDNHFLALAKKSQRGNLDESASEILALLDAGKTPTAKSRADSSAWSTISRFAMKSRNAELAKRAANGLKAAYADNRNSDSYVKGLAESADKLATLVATEKNEEIPAAERDVKVALLEYELRLTQPKAFIEKANGLMATVPATQKEALEAAVLKATFETHVNASRTRDAAVLAESAKALLALIDAGKTPPKALALQVWNTVARHGISTKDPDLVERAADGFESTGEARVTNHIASLRKQAAAMRDSTTN